MDCLLAEAATDDDPLAGCHCMNVLKQIIYKYQVWNKPIIANTNIILTIIMITLKYKNRYLWENRLQNDYTESLRYIFAHETTLPIYCSFFIRNY